MYFLIAIIVLVAGCTKRNKKTVFYIPLHVSKLHCHAKEKDMKECHVLSENQFYDYSSFKN